MQAVEILKQVLLSDMSGRQTRQSRQRHQREPAMLAREFGPAHTLFIEFLSGFLSLLVNTSFSYCISTSYEDGDITIPEGVTIKHGYHDIKHPITLPDGISKMFMVGWTCADAKKQSMRLGYYDICNLQITSFDIIAFLDNLAEPLQPQGNLKNLIIAFFNGFTVGLHPDLHHTCTYSADYEQHAYRLGNSYGIYEREFIEYAILESEGDAMDEQTARHLIRYQLQEEEEGEWEHNDHEAYDVDTKPAREIPCAAAM